MFRTDTAARLSKLLVSATLSTLFALALSANAAAAQLDPGTHDVYQRDQFQNERKVAEIFVPEREPGATFYVEHWVLFDGYVYPSPQLSVVTTIKASRLRYASEADFFARVAWGPGFRYIRVESFDTDQLPGR